MATTLSLDIGGTSVKVALLDAKGKMTTDLLRVETPRPATPARLIAAIGDFADKLSKFDRVSVGFPGVVIDGTTMSAPNLHDTWKKFPLAKALGKRLKKPVRVLNDAGMHGYAVIKNHGVEIVLTLGTGMGFAIYTEGHYVPNIELAHHPFDKKHTYEHYVGLKAFQHVGKKRWNKRMMEVLAQIQKLFYPTSMYLGGGNSTQLTIKLPPNARVVDTAAGVMGGAVLWRD